MLRDPTKLTGERGRRLIFDLNQNGALDAAVSWKAANPDADTIAFVSHVDTEAIAKARAAGIDRVVTRGQFVQQLPQLLHAPD